MLDNFTPPVLASSEQQLMASDEATSKVASSMDNTIMTPNLIKSNGTVGTNTDNSKSANPNQPTGT